MPFYHGFGLLAVAMGCFYLGHRLVCAPQPSPARFAELTKKYRPLILHLVPPLLNFLTQSPLVSAEHLASVSNVIVTGAPVHPAVAKAFTEKASQKIAFQEALGMTEILCLTLTPLLQQKLGSCGKLFPNMEARVEDLETREPLGPHRPGELVVRGPPLFSHYHKNPEATAAAFTPDGWFRTGDVVCYDEDGFLSVVDRFKELIKVKAFQVSPSELEDLILQVEEVLDVGVVGVPDDRSGELPRAFVVLKENVTDPQILGQISNKINSHMKENAAPYKQLAAGIFYVETLPKNRTGKLLRRELRDMAVKT
ncbi:hypothetical protein HAZT_HAZT003961 [Hyalella azteca]|uniref:Uncharacterized protein n=2 Tax=Hyalella azteca TaxID=294128 RepID=A0A6A0H230_HYAAZ|nr:hypothetical protein HAZT_HAZT003961 [Hyalella azteca]